MFKESLKMSWSNIIHNKLRSFLTVLGILIGVAAIISLITVMQGAISEVNSQFEDLGAGMLTVQAPGTPLKQGVSDGDLEKLAQTPNVSGVSPTLSFVSSAVKDGKVNETVTIEGKNEVYFKNSGISVVKGRMLNVLDMTGTTYVCVINEGIAKQLFFGQDPIGQPFLIGGHTYQVVGVMNDAGGGVMAAMGAMFGMDNESKVIIPYKNALKMTGSASVTDLEIYIADTDKTDQTISAIKDVLNQAFNYKEDSYRVINIENLLSTMKTMQGIMTALLTGVASIALLVGGIGIMNMMLVSVTERTREIGLRKALGADPLRIQLQFLIEAIVLSMLGGILGLIMGLMLSAIVCSAIGIAFAPSSSAILIGVGFSAVIGVLFGWAPARKASMLNPIDALRSE